MACLARRNLRRSRSISQSPKLRIIRDSRTLVKAFCRPQPAISHSTSGCAAGEAQAPESSHVSSASQGCLENKSQVSQSLDGSKRASCALGVKPRRTAMPLIEVHLIENVFNPEQKRQIIEKLTDAMVSIEGENMRGVTWVKISEVSSGEWGIGGQPLTTQAVKDLAAGRKAA